MTEQPDGIPQDALIALIALHAGLDQWTAVLDAMEGYIASAVARGYTDEQARQIVVHIFFTLQQAKQ